jgi:predicted DNA-binding transcriptional regulator AlpA
MCPPETLTVLPGEPDERLPNGRLIPATPLSKDMGFTRRTLGRKLHEDPEFPKPVRMAGRLYWFVSYGPFRNGEGRFPQLQERPSKIVMLGA